MSRLARIVVPGFAHHVTQRGNRRGDVFFEDADRISYLSFFDKYRQQYGLEVWAYCLMTNHVHWVVVPKDESSLAKTFRDAHTAFAMAMNRRRKESGHLWQGRFFSCPLDGSHAWAAVRYVERNPVRARMIKRAEDYRWSSAAAHCGKRTDVLLSNQFNQFPPAGVIQDWAAWLRDEEAHQTESIRQKTHTGRPCGTPVFVDQLEALLNRTLHPQKRGPKKKKKNSNRMRVK